MVDKTYALWHNLKNLALNFHENDTFLTYGIEFVLVLAVLENSALRLAHGLKQLTQDAKTDVSCLLMTLARRYEKLCMTFGDGRHTA